MPTVYEIRRSNLERLTKEPGAKTALAIKLDMTASQVSHWLRAPGRPGARVIHEDSARQIEAVLGLAPGALDVPPGMTPAREVDPALLQHVTEVVFAEAQALNVGDTDKLAAVISRTYLDARKAGKVDRSFVRGLLTALNHR